LVALILSRWVSSFFRTVEISPSGYAGYLVTVVVSFLEEKGF